MLEIFTASLLSSILIISYGEFFSNMLFSRQYCSRISKCEKSLIGIIFLTFLAVCLNFVTPLNKEICTLIFFVGILIYLKYRIWSDYLILIITSVLSLVLIAYSNINRPDAGLYHLPIISMINEGKIIFGSSNIHFRFAHGSIIQNFSSIYNIYFFKINFITISTASVFSFFVYYICEKLNFFIRNNNKIFALIFLITLVFSVYSFNRYSGYGNDAVAHIYFIYFFLIILTNDFAQNLRNDLLIKTVLISFFLIGLKLFMILTFIIPIILIIKFDKKFSIAGKKNFYICLFFAFLISLKSIFISGCILYPLKSTCLKSLKIYNQEQISNTSEMSEAWAKGWPDQDGSISNYLDYNKEFKWLKTWKENHLKFILEKIAPLYIFLILIVVMILIYHDKKMKKKNIEKDQKIKNYNILLPFSIFCAIFWFLKFPLYRFGASYLFCLTLILFIIFTEKIINSTSIKLIRYLSIIFVFLSFTGFFYKNLNRVIINSNNNIDVWPKISEMRKSNKIEIEGGGYYYLSKNKPCAYGPSPCTYYKPTNLKFKNIFGYKMFWVEN